MVAKASFPPRFSMPCTAVNASRLARGHRAGIAPDRLQFREAFQRGFGTRMLVLVDDDGPGLAARHRDGRDFLGEVTGSDRSPRALLRADRHRILVGARHLEF